MEVEYLWFTSQSEDVDVLPVKESKGNGLESQEESMVQTLTNMADRRLFKLVKWCKSLPLFRNILVSLIFISITYLRC